MGQTPELGPTRLARRLAPSGNVVPCVTRARTRQVDRADRADPGTGERFFCRKPAERRPCDILSACLVFG